MTGKEPKKLQDMIKKIAKENNMKTDQLSILDYTIFYLQGQRDALVERMQEEDK